MASGGGTLDSAVCPCPTPKGMGEVGKWKGSGVSGEGGGSTLVIISDCNSGK